MEEKIKLYRIS